LLVEALQGFTIDIQHVGSTAVPGLWAKPVLDIDIIIDNENELAAITKKLQALGYLSKGEQGIPGRFAFRQSDARTPFTSHKKEWPSHHLYVCYANSLAVKNHLFFRNALLADKELAERYSTLKRSLVAEKGMTREKYTQHKTGFILSVLSTLGMDDAALDTIRKVNE
jgi:GrpB-like predicted nucleotidyltransferase (UPF0157 family)